MIPQSAPRKPKRTAVRKRRAAQDARVIILDAAERRFAASGFEASRLEDIGADVGIGRPAVLFHFKDKLELYRAVLASVVKEFLAEIEAALVGVGSSADRIEAVFATMFDYMARRPSVAHLTMRAAATTDPTMRRVLQEYAGPLMLIVAQLVSDGTHTGQLQPRSDPFQIASVVVGTTVFYVAGLRTLFADIPYDPLAPEQLAAQKQLILDLARQLLGINHKRRRRS